MPENYFLKSIQALRQQEEILLFENILDISESAAGEVIEFLQLEYQNESIDYPFEVPKFDAMAALWAAKTVYICSQLVLYREISVSDISSVLPDFTNSITPAAILSGDLCLRFLPSIVQQLQIIDSHDGLLPILEKLLNTWHYSGISYPLKIEELDFLAISSNKCVHQLYINRVIEYKNLKLAIHPVCEQGIGAVVGIFAQDFWYDFQLTKTIE